MTEFLNLCNFCIERVYKGKLPARGQERREGTCKDYKDSKINAHIYISLVFIVFSLLESL